MLRLVEGWNVKDVIDEYTGYADPKVRDCDVQYIINYKVSSLDGQFNTSRNRARSLAVPKSRLARLLLATAAVLSVWLTTAVCWERL